MPKDYVHRGQLRKKSRWQSQSIARGRSHKRFPWRTSIILVMLLVIIGGIIGYLKFHHIKLIKRLDNNDQGIVKEARPVVEERKINIAVDQTSNSISPSVQFDFYKVLPNVQVQIPMDDTAKNSIDNRQAQVHQQYVLQLASLKDKDDADNAIEQLSQQGIKAKVLLVQRGAVVWYRVQMGPFRNQQIAQIEQNKLTAKKINSVLVISK